MLPSSAAADMAFLALHLAGKVPVMSSFGSTLVSVTKRWNARFSDPGYLFGTAPNRFLASQAYFDGE